MVMGVVNVTPDSFSDGGEFLDRDAAIARGLSQWGAGADIIDVGGESTRPGSAGVGADEEIERTLPVVAALSAEGVLVSIDTSKAEVAAAALRIGCRPGAHAHAGDPEDDAGSARL
jgi:dihydropteroate synthase